MICSISYNANRACRDGLKPDTVWSKIHHIVFMLAGHHPFVTSRMMPGISVCAHWQQMWGMAYKSFAIR